MDLNHRSLAYETSGDDRTPLLRVIIYVLSGTGTRTRTGTRKAGDFKSPVSTIPPYPQSF